MLKLINLFYLFTAEFAGATVIKFISGSVVSVLPHWLYNLNLWSRNEKQSPLPFYSTPSNREVIISMISSDIKYTEKWFSNNCPQSRGEEFCPIACWQVRTTLTLANTFSWSYTCSSLTFPLHLMERRETTPEQCLLMLQHGGYFQIPLGSVCCYL